MHPCLKLEEILNIIFDQFKETNEVDRFPPDLFHQFHQKNDLDRVTLNSLSTTCKTFHEPAAKKLWATLNSLRPLFKCLPKELWEIKCISGSEVLFLRENPSLDDLARFSIHARRVLHLTGSKVDPAAIHALALITKAPLLPNLRSITVPNIRSIIIPERVDYTVLPTILGPRTEAIHLHVSDGESIQFFSSWRDSHPLVKTLSFIQYSNNYDATQDISDLVNKCQLEELNSRRLSHSAISHLATSPVLRRLRLYLQVGDLSMISLPSFVHLSSLELFTMESASLYKTFMEILGPCRLQELALYEPLSENSADNWLDCFSLLRNKCSHSSLQSLYIELNAHEATFSNCFDPLLAFHNLKEVTIINDRSIFLDDDDVRRFAMEWPELEILCIQTDHIPNEWDRQMTLEGLFFLSQHCPCLQEVSLVSIHVKHFPQVTLSTPNHSIRDISVGNSRIEEADISRIASLFSSLFPGLENIDSWVSFDPGWLDLAGLHASRWGRVVELVIPFDRRKKPLITGSS